MSLLRGLLAGAAAGAAGTTGLNVTTYLDMVGRGRGTSSTPEQTVEKLAEKADLDIPGDDDTRANRVAGLGSLTGLGAGIGVGAGLGALRSLGFRPGIIPSTLLATAGALIGTNGPMTALGITDPRTWATKDWVSDIVPHLVYGFVTAATLDSLDD